MKYVREILWIIAFTLLGEVLNRLLKLPVPAGVYGLFLMLLALLSGLIRLEDVEGAGNFLLDTMTIMFLPAAVGIMTVTELLRPVLLPYLIIILLTTVLVMSVTGLIAEKILHYTENRRDRQLEDAEISLDPSETFGIGRRALSPHGEMDGANGYRDIISQKKQRAAESPMAEKAGKEEKEEGMREEKMEGEEGAKEEKIEEGRE
ncbi:MAG: CidA/LrgA family protein [Oribacterium sp.]